MNNIYDELIEEYSIRLGEARYPKCTLKKFCKKVIDHLKHNIKRIINIITLNY